MLALQGQAAAVVAADPCGATERAVASFSARTQDQQLKQALADSLRCLADARRTAQLQHRQPAAGSSSSAGGAAAAAPEPRPQPAPSDADTDAPTMPPAPLACANPDCGATTDLRRCGGCAAVRYCSEACSRAHWRAHKAECRRLQAEQRADGGAGGASGSGS